MTTEAPVRIARDHLPYPVRLAAAWSVCLLLIAGGAWLVGEGIAKLSLIVGPVAIAILLAAMLRPLVDRIPERVPRVLAAVVVVIGVLAAVITAFALVASQLASGFPRMRAQIASGTDAALRWLENGPLHLTADRLQDAVTQARGWLTHHTDLLASGAIHVGHTAVDTVASVLICLVSLFFFLYQGEKMWTFFVRWMPAASREHFDIAFRHGWASLGAYSRTQLAVAAINAAGVGIGAWALKVPFVIPIVVVVFFASFVPIVGTLIGGLVPTVLALVDRGLVIALVMLAIVAVVHLTESHVLQPLMMGHAVALHPLAVILVVAGGTYLFGVIGALFAVPITAMANSIVRYLANKDAGPGPLPSLHDLSGPDHPHHDAPGDAVGDATGRDAVSEPGPGAATGGRPDTGPAADPDSGRDPEPRSRRALTMPAVEVVRSSIVAAPRHQVWSRVVTAAGVAHEFGPLLTMRFPAALEGGSITGVALGRPLGRAWILVAGLLPVEFDDLQILEVEEPRYFRERSRLGTCRVWEHRRELDRLTDGSTRVTDTLRAEPRLLVPGPVVRAVVGALFAHRHRRLIRAFEPA